MATVAMRCFRSLSVARQNISRTSVLACNSSMEQRSFSVQSMRVASESRECPQPRTSFEEAWQYVPRASTGDICGKDVPDRLRWSHEASCDVMAYSNNVGDLQALLRGLVAMNRNARRPKKVRRSCQGPSIRCIETRSLFALWISGVSALPVM